MWRCYLGLTMSGAIGPLLDVSAGTLTQTVNEHDNLSVTFSRASLAGVGREWWSYRSGCLVVTYTDAHGVERIVSACPISGAPVEDHRAGTVTLEGRGVGWLLEDRIILDRDYTTNDFTDLRTGRVASKTSHSWSAVIGRIIRDTTGVKRQGYLPLLYPSVSTAGEHSYAWDNWDLANNGAWARIKEVLDAEDGPDMMIRAEWVDGNHTQFRWRAIVGTDEQRTIPQDDELYLDGTVPGSDVATVEVASDPSTVCHRVYATGAGEGRGVAMGFYEMKSIPEHMPLIERVHSDTGIQRDATDGTSKALTKAAKSQIVTSAIEELSISVNADPARLPIGTWWCAETALVRLAGWLTVPDGEYRVRMIAVNYTLGSDMVSIDCQEQKLGEDYQW